MSVGDGLNQRQVDTMNDAAQAAGQRCGLHFSVFVGASDGEPRAFASRLLSALGTDAPRAVVLHVDPKAGRVEIVTGPEAAARLDDHSCRLASTEMAAMCGAGDIVGGVVTGLRMLGDAVFWSSADRATATGTT